MRSIILILLFATGARAQTGNELNIGAHVNPVFTIPFVSSKSVRSEDLRVAEFRPGYNLGFNINYKLKEFSLELAANYVHKTLSIAHRVGSFMSQNAYYRVSVRNKSFEFPLTINFLLGHHEGKTTYDSYLFLGAAYEFDFFDSSSSSSKQSGGPVDLYVEGNYGGPLQQHMIAPVIGFKINANLSRVGLIDYGVGWHFPLANTGPYNAEARLSSGSSSVLFSNSIFASNTWIDVKLCYYFLNIGKGLKRVRYRN
jgi:hypothetical protein